LNLRPRGYEADSGHQRPEIKIETWEKNDYLGFEIFCVFKGVVKNYRPDFLICLATGKMLFLEVKGQDTQQDQSKRAFLNERCKGVNTHGRFGAWEWDVSYDTTD
jgi:type III restriction enzyme